MQTSARNRLVVCLGIFTMLNIPASVRFAAEMLSIRFCKYRLLRNAMHAWAQAHAARADGPNLNQVALLISVSSARFQNK